MTSTGGTRATLGMELSRVDGPAKVTGSAPYAAEHFASDLVYAVVVSSTIAKGRVASIDDSAARAVPGVIEVITHENRPKVRKYGIFYKDMTSPSGKPFRPLLDDRVVYSGQPLALVVAETFEAARYAASLVSLTYEREPHDTNLMKNLARAYVPGRLKLGYSPPPKPRGDAHKAFGAAAVKVDVEFYSGVEHHNPLEMHATTVLRADNGHLTVYDKNQGSQNVRQVMSRVFGLAKDKLTVRNPYVGGAFGSGLRPQYQTYLAIMAALKLERSVKLVLTRQQMFTFGHRPETWQHVRLAADRDGKLQAITHDAVIETSRWEDYTEVVVNWSGQLYACDNVALDFKVVDLDQYTPLDMRAPGASHGVHAVEVAMDELSYALAIDPLELRLKNYAEKDSNTDLPFSSKELRACYAQAAERFGWSKRNPTPRATVDGDELIGWGMATGTWDAMQQFGRARVTLTADGRLNVTSGASDIGTGTYTVMTLIAAEAMGLPIEAVTFELGDSNMPFAPIEGGSSHVTTIGSAIAGACDKLKEKLWKLARKTKGSLFKETELADVVFADGGLQLRSDASVQRTLAQILADAGKEKLEVAHLLLPNMLEQKNFTRATHSAVFAEVRVDEAMGTVRVTRVASAIAAGRIMNMKTARSQIIGGVVWGISQALHEETHADHRFGRFMNHNLSEYHVPVNADINAIDVLFVDEDDRIVSSLGAKGVGEIGIVGVSAAICNAIYHATGRRIRSTPMTPERSWRRKLITKRVTQAMPSATVENPRPGCMPRLQAA